MTPNDNTPKKAENAQVQAVRKEFTLMGGEQNLDPAALGSRTPLELLADWLEAEAACDGTHEASVLAVLARSRVITLDPAALRAQAEAGASEITWDAAVSRLMQGGNLVLTARGDSELLSALLREASDRLGDGEMHVHEEFEAGGLWYQEQQVPTQAGTVGGAS
ncbi:hypothetical protein [Deinococcus sp. UR1]|uniref:hypothetical protein n=1 Tax=Deinococcus sp. UR1 TaxID=1704277 RepID=UPI0006DD1A9A|nr:hypothetical protein [Deinococcus sp. UR1]PIG98918.1 hypothetical protein AMD26_006610 [Deinococcus sp. UR1]